MEKRYTTPTVCTIHVSTVSMIAASTLTVDGNNASVESTYEEGGYAGEFSSRRGRSFGDE